MELHELLQPLREVRTTYSLKLVCDRTEADLLSAEFYGAGTLGVIEEDLPEGGRRIQAFFHDGKAAAALAKRYVHCRATLCREPAVDWVKVSRSQWQPILIGARLYLTPKWRHDRTPPGRLRLEMPTGTASGTGIHPATQLVLEALDGILRQGDRVLDLGTGSGILSAAASLLGAGAVFACDIDEDAARSAREYCAASAAVFTGSVRSLSGTSTDLVLVNINAAAIAGLAQEIARILRPKGRAILAGFTGRDANRVTETLHRVGLIAVQSRSKDEWFALIAERRK